MVYDADFEKRKKKMSAQKIVIVGGGPAGLMVAYELLQLQKNAMVQQVALPAFEIHLYDAMPSVGRKFLLAGIGGLNLTHSEPADLFESRYSNSDYLPLPPSQASCPPPVKEWLQDFSAVQVREWAQTLGISTFVGSSGRVFPEDMKAAPLLRAWLHEMRFPKSGTAVKFHLSHRCVGLRTSPLELDFLNAQNESITVQADKLVFALGGGSWPKLGSNGLWQSWLHQLPLSIETLTPSNCGFDVLPSWSPLMQEKFAGAPLKSVAIRLLTEDGKQLYKKGEMVLTAFGLEGSLIYAYSAHIRQLLQQNGRVTLGLNLLPDWTEEKIKQALMKDRGSKSLSKHLKTRLGIDGVKSALLYEVLTQEQLQDPTLLAQALQNLPLTLISARPIEEAISSAGGVKLDQLNEFLAYKPLPNLYFTGEMLDWDAPTGGYLLTACLASGKRVAKGIFLSLLN